MALRIVARMDPQAARTGRFFAFSAGAHLLIALTIVLAPGFGGRAAPDVAATFVDLVSAVPAAPGTAGPPSPAEPEPPPAEPEAEPESEPEGVHTAAPPVPAKPEKKPEPKKEPPKAPPKKEKKPAASPTTPKANTSPAPTPAPATTPGSGGGSGAAKGEAGASVSPLGGAAGDVALGWYEGQVTSSLYHNWTKPLLDGIREPLEVHVAFEILRDGRIQDPRILQPSGVPTLDRSALRAVHNASPLPPLPPNWKEPVLPATFIFRLNPS